MGDPQPLTVADYLTIDEASQERHQFFDGEIFAMAGGSIEHAILAAHVQGLLYSGLKDSSCTAIGSDMRVRISEKGDYSYPDITIYCGKPEIEQDSGQSLLNPKVIIEILSDSTEAFDRGKKAEAYRALPSVQEYILVAQDRFHIEHYIRGDGRWALLEYANAADTLQLNSVPCSLPLAEIYQRVL